METPHSLRYRLGLNGLLNPPTRFIYCLYSVFFSFLTPDTLFPFTFVFFVDLNPVKPIALRISAISGSESASTSMASFSCFAAGSVEEVVPLTLAVGLESLSVLLLGGCLDDEFLVKARGPVGGARSEAGLEGGLRDRGTLEDRGGVRVRVRAEVCSLRGERDRERRDGGSSAVLVSPPHTYLRGAPMHQPRRDLCFSLLLLRSLSLLSLIPSRSASLGLRAPLSRE